MRDIFLLVITALSLALPLLAADDNEATTRMIRTLPEPFRTDLALRWSDRGGLPAHRMLEELFAERAYTNLAPFPMVTFIRDISSTANQLSLGSNARVDRLSLGIRAVQWMQPKSAHKARVMLERVTEELESARWVAPDCKDLLLPVWSYYFAAVPTAISQGFTEAERVKGDDLEFGRRSMRLIRSISQLHDALKIFDHAAISGKVRTAMIEELTLRLSGWPISSPEWWVHHKSLIERASKIPEVAIAFRALAERALNAPVCGMQTQAPPPQVDALRFFNSAFAAQAVKPLEWNGKPSWQARAPIETPSTDDDYRYFLNGVRRLQGQLYDRQNEPQWRQAYRDLVSELGTWKRADLSSIAFVATKLSAIGAMVALPSSGRPPNVDEIYRQKKALQQPEEVSSSAPVAEFFDTLTSLDGLEVQAKHPGYWLIRLTMIIQQIPTLAPGVQQRYEAAIARQTNPVIQAYAKAAKEGWL